MSEIKDKSVLLVHALSGCMFHCYECINYEEIVLKKHHEYLTIEDVISVVHRQNDLVDMIVFSGGEFLISPIEDLIKDLRKVRESTSKPIIIYTTGYYFDKMDTLIQENLVDGFHMDMKLPYHLIDDEDSELMMHTLGKVLNANERLNLLKSIDLIVRTDQGFSQIRSVKYLFLSESAFMECELYIKEINCEYHKNVPYEVHPFYKVNNE